MGVRASRMRTKSSVENDGGVRSPPYLPIRAPARYVPRDTALIGSTSFSPA